MKKLIALMLVIIVLIQIGAVASAFKDTVKNPYTGKLYTHDDKFSASNIVHGVDISYYQSLVDWATLKSAGMDYVILRAAYRGYGNGKLVKDTKFAEYAAAANSAGLDVGAYIYSQAITTAEAVQEANYILNIVKGFNIELPIVFDFEYAATGVGRLYNANLSKTAATDICLAFCKTVEDAGYTAMVYANQSMLTQDLNDETIAKEYDIWLANYSTSPKYGGKMYDCDYTYWQYTSTGKVNGVNTVADCNFRYFKKPLKVKNLTIISETLDDTTLSWSKIKGCYGYRIYRYNEATSKYEKIGSVKGAGKTSFTDTASDGKVNSYKVRAVSVSQNKNVLGTLSNAVVSAGVFNSAIAENYADSTTIKWNAYSAKTPLNYNVYRSDKADGDYSLVGKTDVDTFEYKDENIKPFATYYYKIAALVDESEIKASTIKRQIVEYFTPTTEVVKPVPVLTSVSLKTNSSIEIVWQNALGAQNTRIYRQADNGKIKVLATIDNGTTTNFVDKTVKKGVQYKYYVKNLNIKNAKKYFSVQSKTKSAVPLKKTTVSLTSYKKKIKVAYTAVKGRTKYEIYMKKKGEKYKLIKTTTKTAFTKKSLKSKTTYYFKVRSYKSVNGKKVYSQFSKAKKIKTK